MCGAAAAQAQRREKGDFLKDAFGPKSFGYFFSKIRGGGGWGGVLKISRDVLGGGLGRDSMPLWGQAPGAGDTTVKQLCCGGAPAQFDSFPTSKQIKLLAFSVGARSLEFPTSKQIKLLAFCLSCKIRCSIVVSISACHAEDPGSIPGGGSPAMIWLGRVFGVVGDFDELAAPAPGGVGYPGSKQASFEDFCWRDFLEF